jgi:hypothetical protein
VIWAEPKITVWDIDFKPCREPLSVMQWKVINEGDRKSQQAIKQAEHIADDEWLLEKSRRASGFTDTPYLSATVASSEFLPVQEWMPDNAGHILQNWLTLN